jgi:hypothetical protein
LNKAVYAFSLPGSGGEKSRKDGVGRPGACFVVTVWLKSAVEYFVNFYSNAPDFRPFDV